MDIQDEERKKKPQFFSMIFNIGFVLKTLSSTWSREYFHQEKIRCLYIKKK